MKSKGFTLLEITVVVAIITLLSTIFLANYREGEKQFSLQRSAHKLAQDLRRTQEMAMSSQKVPLDFDSEEPFPKGGYGIHFMVNPTQGYCQTASKGYCIILFADCNNNGNYDKTGGATSCGVADELTAYPEKIEEISLEEGIYILELSSQENPLSIIFFPPDPIVTINPSANSASINLGVNGQSKTVFINITGLIDVE